MAKSLKKVWKPAGGTFPKVDMEELSKSQATLVFGQMNEPPAQGLLSLYRDLLLQNTSVTGIKKEKEGIFYSLLIIFSGLHRQVQKYRIIGTYAFCSGLPAYTLQQKWAGRKGHLYKAWFNYLGTGNLCSCR